MSFRLFIYYCAMCGAAAAFVGWMVGRSTAPSGDVLAAAIKAFWLGLLVACGLGLVDALWNLSLGQVGTVVLRVAAAMVVGGIGGFIGGFVGQVLYGRTEWRILLILGWTITGLLIGASVGAFDLLASVLQGEDAAAARRKILKGLIGGGLGGILGGLLYVLLQDFWGSVFHNRPEEKLWSPSATGFVVLGACIGLLIGLAQVILKEAWLKVEKGFRAGREMILSKSETTIGRAENCDIGLFGDRAVERLHARIVLTNNAYFLVDAGSSDGTYLNGRMVRQPTPLHSDDLIKVGNSVLRFRERTGKK